MSALSTIHGIVVRDLRRSSRQTGRLLGGLARPFMWLLLVGTGYNAIARVESGAPYQAYVLPGIIVMAALFGGMLTAIATVYDREFGMLRLMLASPAGIPSILAGRALAATLLAILQGGVVLACAPFITPLTPRADACGGRRPGGRFPGQRITGIAGGRSASFGGELRRRDQCGALSAALRERCALPYRWNAGSAPHPRGSQSGNLRR